MKNPESFIGGAIGFFWFMMKLRLKILSWMDLILHTSYFKTSYIHHILKQHIINLTGKYKFKVMVAVPNKFITMDIVFTCEQYWNRYRNRCPIFDQYVQKSACQGLNMDAHLLHWNGWLKNIFLSHWTLNIIFQLNSFGKRLFTSTTNL